MNQLQISVIPKSGGDIIILLNSERRQEEPSASSFNIITEKLKPHSLIQTGRMPRVRLSGTGARKPGKCPSEKTAKKQVYTPKIKQGNQVCVPLVKLKENIRK